MVLPRFSLRWIFLATAVFSVVSLIFAQAFRGHQWAIALSGTILAAVLMLCLLAGAFLVASLIRLLSDRRKVSLVGESPFAKDIPVKQVLEPPPDPDL